MPASSVEDDALSPAGGGYPSSVGRDDWFRGPDWDVASQQNFEERLKRARDDNRPQYLRIKAVGLLASADPIARDGGVTLLQRVIDEHPNNWMHAPFTHELLGRGFLIRGDRGRAKEHFRAAVETASPTRSGTSGGLADLALVELLVEDGELDEAVRRWDDVNSPDIPLASTRKAMPLVEFQYSRAEAKLRFALGDRQAAATAARTALTAASATQSGLRWHRDLMSVPADEPGLRALRVLAEAADENH